ncbi:hypothetical protein [Micromonospora okii]|uniref:hypothetical protein n=1 Tax=Micromonospora okii TaxID=1182970 RepID=UPI001E4E8413|nr:hypothetical protein [Micromonospora okii]
MKKLSALRPTGRGLASSAAVILAAGAVLMTGASPAAAAPAAYQCRDGEAEIAGGFLSFQLCWGNDIGTMIDYSLWDTAPDGRRAEIWVKYPGSPSNGEKVGEVTGGDGDVLYSVWHDSNVSSGVYPKLCTSNANTARRCTGWL